MAKAAERVRRNASLREQNVPIKALRCLQSAVIKVELAVEVPGSRSASKVKKVISELHTSVRMAGFTEPFASKTTIEVDPSWDGCQELEKGLRSAFFDAIGHISKKYKTMYAEKKAETDQARESTQAKRKKSYRTPAQQQAAPDNAAPAGEVTSAA